MERQQRVQDRERAVRGSQKSPGFSDMLKSLPLVYDGVLWCRPCPHLARNLAKRHRPPPKGRRYVFHHGSALQLVGKAKVITKTAPNLLTETLDCGLRK